MRRRGKHHHFESAEVQRTSLPHSFIAMRNLSRILSSPRRAILYATLGRARYQRLMADVDAQTRADWLAASVAAVPEVTRQFHLLSYYSGALQQTYWLGVP